MNVALGNDFVERHLYGTKRVEDMSRYRDWLRQAENDLLWAEHSLAGGFWAQTCFVAQQAAEKAF